MTTEQGQVPTPSIETMTSYRPAWVTDQLVAQWCEWVRRDVTRHEEPAPQPATAVAPYDLSPTATVPTCAPEDVASSVVAAREAQRMAERIGAGSVNINDGAAAAAG